MHHKFIVVDNFNASADPLVLLGSHNWSTSAETRNDENTLVIHDKTIADQYYQAFQNLYLEAGGILAVPEIASNKKNVILYPNPTDGLVSLKVDGNLMNSKGKISVYSVAGTLITERDFPNANNASIDLSNYQKGLYFVNITIGELKYQSKIIKK